ncbi:MAG: hypothetical protein AB7I50_12275 [Vicinamibacterales bacterium]
MAAPTELERDLQQLAADLRRLEVEYTQYFAGRLPRPPLPLRSSVEAMMKRLDRAPFEQIAQRFRFQTLQSRYATFSELWDRSMRQREEGRGPAAVVHTDPESARSKDVLLETAIADPARQNDQIGDLYDVLCEARRKAGEREIPFDKFVEVVTGQIEKSKHEGAGPVTFRVTTKDGKVRFTARSNKGSGS